MSGSDYYVRSSLIRKLLEICPDGKTRAVLEHLLKEEVYVKAEEEAD